MYNGKTSILQNELQKLHESIEKNLLL